ncbi:MAG: DUF4035 domain-containing protein [Kiritimatiellae bacterium]|nr:DUF4035 domain-containing protein [Kiritimatiellia bacterium]
MREAQARCDSREFAEWMAYRTLSPWGQERGDLQAALIASLIARTMGGSKSTDLNDFMLKFGEAAKKKEQQSPEFIFEVLRIGAKAKAAANVHGNR